MDDLVQAALKHTLISVGEIEWDILEGTKESKSKITYTVQQDRLVTSIVKAINTVDSLKSALKALK